MFTRIYSGGNFEEGVSAFRMPDGSYRLLGNSASYGWGDTNIWVIALDSQAHFQWHKVVSLAGNDRVNDAVMDHKGNLHLCGTSSAQPQLTYQLMYMKIDPFGTAQQTKYYGGAAWEQGYGIAFDTDSNIVLVGETYSTPLGDAQGYILKINGSGDSLWQKTIGGNNDDVLKAVMIDTQNRIFAVGGNQKQKIQSMAMPIRLARK